MPSEFEDAQVRVRNLSKTPNQSELLELYALFKQGTLGDCQGKRPSILDLRGRAKFDAWSKLTGVSRDEAQGRYVRLVSDLEARYGK